MGQKWAWRYLVPVTDREGREWGWCALPGGWGERWSFVTWNPQAPDDPDKYGGKVGGPLTDGRGQDLKFSSKEAILAKLPALIAEREILDRWTRVAVAMDRAAESARRNRQYEAEAEERAARREREAAEAEAARLETLDGLRSIRDAAGTRCALTNLELAALDTAIRKFERG